MLLADATMQRETGKHYSPSDYKRLRSTIGTLMKTTLLRLSGSCERDEVHANVAMRQASITRRDMYPMTVV